MSSLKWEEEQHWLNLKIMFIMEHWLYAESQNYVYYFVCNFSQHGMKRGKGQSLVRFLFLLI